MIDSCLRQSGFGEFGERAQCCPGRIEPKLLPASCVRVLVREIGGRPQDQDKCYQDCTRAVESSVQSRFPSHDQVGGIITRPQPQSRGHNSQTQGLSEGTVFISSQGFPPSRIKACHGCLLTLIRTSPSERKNGKKGKGYLSS